MDCQEVRTIDVGSEEFIFYFPNPLLVIDGFYQLCDARSPLKFPYCFLANLRLLRSCVAF